MELLDFYEKRLKDLEKNITRDQELLKQYDDELAYASDPRAMGRYERETSNGRFSWQIEYARHPLEQITDFWTTWQEKTFKTKNVQEYKKR